VGQQKCALIFDVDLGGVLTSVHQTTRSAKAAQFQIDHDETMQTTWQRTSAGHVVPVNRQIQLTERDGNQTRTVATRIEFMQFHAADVAPDQVEFGALDVVPGTPVVDHIRFAEWRYGALGEKGLPTDASLRQALASGQAQAIPKPRVGIGSLPLATHPANQISGPAPWHKIALAGAVALLAILLMWNRTRRRQDSAQTKRSS
jgi:hypothetical protein